MIKQKLNVCPFGMKKHEECTFYRKGIKIITTPHGEEQEPFEECAVNIIADCLENMISRQIGLQKEMNEVRNEVMNVRNETSVTNKIFIELLNRQAEYLDKTKKLGEI